MRCSTRLNYRLAFLKGAGCFLFPHLTVSIVKDKFGLALELIDLSRLLALGICRAFQNLSRPFTKPYGKTGADDADRVVLATMRALQAHDFYQAQGVYGTYLPEVGSKSSTGLSILEPIYSDPRSHAHQHGRNR